jgi:hypothetical protein
MTHTSWNEIKASVGRKTVNGALTWLKGYVNALEDVLVDLEHMSQHAREVPYDTHTLLFAKARIRDTLDGARDTLATLAQIPDEGERS